jgi:hypothetical protein
VVINRKLKDVEPMAWDFVMNFAKDNDLQITPACSAQALEEMFHHA